MPRSAKKQRIKDTGEFIPGARKDANLHYRRQNAPSAEDASTTGFLSLSKDGMTLLWQKPKPEDSQSAKNLMIAETIHDGTLADWQRDVTGSQRHATSGKKKKYRQSESFRISAEWNYNALKRLRERKKAVNTFLKSDIEYDPLDAMQKAFDSHKTNESAEIPLSDLPDHIPVHPEEAGFPIEIDRDRYGYLEHTCCFNFTGCLIFRGLVSKYLQKTDKERGPLAKILSESRYIGPNDYHTEIFARLLRGGKGQDGAELIVQKRLNVSADKTYRILAVRRAVVNDPDMENIAFPGVVIKTVGEGASLEKLLTPANRKKFDAICKIGKKKALKIPEIRQYENRDVPEGHTAIGAKQSNGLIIPLESAELPSDVSAEDYINANYGRLMQKANEFDGMPLHRCAPYQGRIGPMHSDSAITPEKFMETFGFKGVQWGNWLDQAEREKTLHRAFNAFMDLANILGIEPQGVSLGGTLNIAFGSRGRGGRKAPMAHYETDHQVINLTKKHGAGCIAHEWFHALDHKLGNTLSTSQHTLWTEMPEYRRPHGIESSGIRMLDRILHVHSDISKRSKKLDKKTRKKYYQKPCEIAARGFESVVNHMLEKAGRINKTLVTITPEAMFGRNTDSWQSQDRNNVYPYFFASEIDYAKDDYKVFLSDTFKHVMPDIKILAKPFEIPVYKKEIATSPKKKPETKLDKKPDATPDVELNAEADSEVANGDMNGLQKTAQTETPKTAEMPKTLDNPEQPEKRTPTTPISRDTQLSFSF